MDLLRKIPLSEKGMLAELEILKSKAIPMIVSAEYKEPVRTGANFFTYDINTGELCFKLCMPGGESLPLRNIAHITISFMFVDNRDQPIEEIPVLENGNILDAEAGIFHFIVPAAQIQETGRVLGEVAIQFNDNRSIVAGRFVLNITKALIDKPLSQDIISYWIRTFDELREYILQRQSELEQAIANNEQSNNQNQTELEARMTANEERLEQHTQDVNDAGIVMQGEFQQLLEDVHGIASARHVMNTSWSTIEDTIEGKVTEIKMHGWTFNNILGELIGTSGATLTGNVITVTSVNPGATAVVQTDATMFKASTQYTVVIDLAGVNGNANFRTAGIGGHNPIAIPSGISDDGRHVLLVTSMLDMSTVQNLQIGFADVTTTLTNPTAEITIIEGDVRELIEEQLDQTQTLTNSEPESIRVVGENLFVVESMQGNTANNFIELIGSNSIRVWNTNVATWQWRSFQMRVRPNTTYRFVRNGGGSLEFRWLTSEMTALSEWSTLTNILNLNAPNNARLLEVRMYSSTGSATQGNSIITDIQLIHWNGTLPPFTPTVTESVAVEVLIDGEWQTPVLRSIQNGAVKLVADTIESNEQGELVMVQRVEVVDLEIVGIMNINTYGQTTQFLLDTFNPLQQGLSSLRVNSNRLPTTHQGWNSGVVGVQIDSGVTNSGRLIVRVPLLTPQPPVGTLRQYLIDNNYEFLAPLANPIIRPVRPINLPSYEPATHVQINSNTPVSPQTSFKIATSVAQRLSLLIQRVANLESWRNEFESEFEVALANLSAEMLRAEDMILPTNHFHADIPISNYPLGPSGMRIESNTLNWPHAGLRVETFRYADNAGVQRAVTMANIEFRRIASNNAWGQWTPMPSQLEIDALVAEIAKLKANNENSRTARKSFGHYVNQELADVKLMAKAFDLVLNNQNQEFEKLVSELNDQNQEFKKLASENKRLTKLVDYLCSELGINVEVVDDGS